MVDSTSNETRISGIGTSPGIAIGKAYLVVNCGINVVKQYNVTKNRLNGEIRRFKSAVKHAGDELHTQAIKNTGDDDFSRKIIIETHELLLKDKMLYDQTIDTIQKENINAEWALNKVITRLKTEFRDMTNNYMKDRASDIVQVSDAVMRHLSGSPRVHINEIQKRVILVARDLSPAEAGQIQLERIKAFITDLGGQASHTSIVARTLAIPAIVGLGDVSRRIGNDDVIIVDGASGTVIIHPTEKTLLAYEERRVAFEKQRIADLKKSRNPAITTDARRIHILGNIELPGETDQVLAHGAEGIGLFRTEFQYIHHGNSPAGEMLFEQYKNVVEVMGNRPVTIRTLDINGDKFMGTASEVWESNPALGLRAIRYCLKNPDIFKTQLKAILRAADYGNVKILFPLICSLEELSAAKRMLAEAEKELADRHIPFGRSYQVGMMMEVPSAIMMADHFAPEVDFFSIGTNDLIQYTLAIDRTNREVAHLYQPMHPAILKLLHQLSKTAERYNIDNIMCGEMAADPVNLPILLGFGINTLSMTLRAIPDVKNNIRKINLSEARQLAGDILKEKTADAVSRLVREAFGDTLTNVS